MRRNESCHYKRPFNFDCRTNGQSYQKQDTGTSRPFRRLRGVTNQEIADYLKVHDPWKIMATYDAIPVSRMSRVQRFTARHFYWWMNTTACYSIIHSAIPRLLDYWNKHPVSQTRPIFRQRLSNRSFYWTSYRPCRKRKSSDRTPSRYR